MLAKPVMPQVREHVLFEEALERVLDAAMPLGAIERPLCDAPGRMLAEEIAATEPSPFFDQSAVDGYAVQAEDVSAASPDHPVTLTVIDEVAAGAAPSRALSPGAAIRVMTGAPLPPGTDAMIPVEQTREPNAWAVEVCAPARAGDFIRRMGEDVQPGMILISTGTRLSPAHIGLLAAQGRTSVRLFRQPAVALLSTGNELVGEAGNGHPGPTTRIRDANGPMLAALIAGLGCPVINLGVAVDDASAIRAKLRAAFSADVVVTTGGVSAGRHDHVIAAAEACGVEWLFRKVRIKPGMPLVAGRRGRQLFFGLPGNPVSALVTCIQFVRPALLKMMGAQNPLERVVVPAVLEHAIAKGDRKRHFHRVIVERHRDGYIVRSSGGQGSHMVASLARANGLMVIPEESGGVEAGQLVDVELL